MYSRTETEQAPASSPRPTLGRRLLTWVGLLVVLSGSFIAAACMRAQEKPQAKIPTLEFPADYYASDLDDPQITPVLELIGKPMPPIAVSNWINGEVKPADLKGKVVLLDLWATWCGPCVAAIPHNNALYAENKDKGLVVIGVCSSDTGQEKFPEAAKRYAIAYPAGTDPTLKTEAAYKNTFYPAYFAIDRKGVIRAAAIHPSKVEDVVKKLLAEKAD